MKRWVRSGSLGGLLVIMLGLCGPAQALEPRVQISPGRPHVDVVHEGRKVRIQRIQDVHNRLLDDDARTSRPCPPACIQPMLAAPGVETVGELELLDFLARDVQAGTGLLLDVRLPELYRLETVPAALNVPHSVMRADNPHIDRILLALGASRTGSIWDFSQARTLTLFASGPWSDEAVQAVLALRALGYPPTRMRFYRGGLQAWRMLGLTTVVPGRGT
ncbi:MAG: hypothetical protein JNJ71_17295 [Rubrivivax sp.]|nr:hypothetical protein [Rubrivivax sp.]